MISQRSAFLRRLIYKQLCITQASCLASVNHFGRAVGSTGVASGSEVSMPLEMAVAVVAMHGMSCMAVAPVSLVVVAMVMVVVMTSPVIGFMHLPVKLVLLRDKVLIESGDLSIQVTLLTPAWLLPIMKVGEMHCDLLTVPLGQLQWVQSTCWLQCHA